jgi:hypothetical protein
MDLQRLCRNTLYKTVPLHELKVGTLVYLFEELAQDAEPSLLVWKGLRSALILSCDGKKLCFSQKRCVALKEISNV